MKNIEGILDVLTTALAKEPMFVLALVCLVLVGFAMYVLLAIVKLLTNKES